jgi:hypothetical protein
VLAHSELLDGNHLSSLYSCLIAVSHMPETTTFIEASDIISEEIQMQRLFREATAPSGKLQFFRYARRTLFLFGGPNPNTVRGHSMAILAKILYRDAVISELDWFVLKYRDWLSSLFKVETLVLGGKHNSRVQVRDILSPDGGQAAANANDGGSANRNGTVGVIAGSPSNENIIRNTSITGDRLEMVNEVARLGQFSQDQMNAANSMRNRRLGISESTIVVNGDTNLHEGNATVSGIGTTRENTTGNTTRPMNAAGRLVADPGVRPNVVDGEFFWYNTMSENLRTSGMRAIQSEFRKNNRFCRLVSADLADEKPPVVLQDVHLNAIRAFKKHRFTEPDARECLSSLYGGAAARRFTKLLKENRYADTATLMGKMESIYINYTTRRQASAELRKLRMSPNAGSHRAGIDDYVNRLQTYSLSCTEEDQSDSALINIFLASLEGIKWARHLRSALISKTVTSFTDLCNTASSLATDEDTELGVAGINYNNYGQRLPQTAGAAPVSRPMFDQRRLGNLSTAVKNYAKTRTNPLDRRTGKPMVCRSLGCSSTSHFQYSGLCPVQVERIQNGTAAVHMAESFANDITNGCDFLDCVTEVLLSQCSDENTCDISGIGGLSDVVPSRVELDRNVVDAGYVASGPTGLSDLLCDDTDTANFVPISIDAVLHNNAFRNCDKEGGHHDSARAEQSMDTPFTATIEQQNFQSGRV